MNNPAASRAITIRLRADDTARLEGILKDVPLSNAHAVVRAAAQLGLGQLAGHPDLVVALLRDQSVQIGR